MRSVMSSSVRVRASASSSSLSRAGGWASDRSSPTESCGGAVLGQSGSRSYCGAFSRCWACQRRRGSVGLFLEQVSPARFLLARFALQSFDERLVAGDQSAQSVFNFLDRSEAVLALAARLDLPDRLRPAQQQDRERCRVAVGEAQSVEGVRVLERAAPGAADSLRELALSQSKHRRCDRALVVCDDRVSAGALVARGSERIGAERVRLWRRGGLLYERTQHTNLFGRKTEWTHRHRQNTA